MLFLSQNHAMGLYWGSVCIAFLTSALGGGEWSSSRLGRFILRERAPGTHWIGGWADPRASLDVVVKGIIPISCRDSKIQIIRPVAQRCTTECFGSYYEILIENKKAGYWNWRCAYVTAWYIFQNSRVVTHSLVIAFVKYFSLRAVTTRTQLTLV
jgi:hypothetical protein